MGLYGKPTKSFEEWLTDSGAEVLEKKGDWDKHRFRALGRIHTVYFSKRKSGLSFSSDDCEAIYLSYMRGQKRKLKNPARKYCSTAKEIDYLTRRDGRTCFYCFKRFNHYRQPTVEHLVPKSHGGPNHRSNYVLACEGCNQKAGNKSVAAKIKMREAAQERIRRDQNKTDQNSSSNVRANGHCGDSGSQSVSN